MKDNTSAPNSKPVPEQVAELPLVKVEMKPAIEWNSDKTPIARSGPVGDDFWETLDGAFELTEQPRTAIYWTKSNHVGIRQQDLSGDEDPVVIIDPEKIDEVIHAIKTIARDILETRDR